MKPVVIIGEIGINGNGDLGIVLELIKKAKFAGVDLIKFQKRNISKVYSKEELDKPRESPWGKTNRDQKAGLEFGKKEYDIIDEFCRNYDIPWFASSWDLDSQSFIKQYNLQYNKVASALLTHIPLVTEIAKEGKYTYISTGMSTLEEIDNVVEIFKQYKCLFELMHCNSAYPMPDADANLRTIRTLKHRYNCDVGYSDHSTGIITSVLAVALGATSIERHITLDRSMYGSDQAASLEINGLKKMIEYIRVAEVAIGDGVKTITETEEKCKAKLRRTCDL